MANPKTPGRMIRRDIADSEHFAALSPEAAVLFCMIIPHLDSYGKLNGGAGYIKDEVCPKVAYLTYRNIPRLLDEISRNTTMKYFEHGGRRWIHTLGFGEYQKLRQDRLGQDLLPDYPGLTPRGLTPGRVPPKVEVKEEVKVEVKEEVKVEKKEKIIKKEKVTDVKESKVPENFTVTEKTKTWARLKGLSPERIQRETEAFVNWHLAKGTKYKDWQRAWRNWALISLRREPPDIPPVDKDGFFLDDKQAAEELKKIGI